ncbi:MAG: hypothetical protein WCJ72_10210 [Chryseobacterium sp.]|jgi:hypothetical protein
MKINGFEYSKEEVLEALKSKGYLILRYSYLASDQTFPGGVQTWEVHDLCAVKGADLPSEKNLWENVAIKEFQKEFIKPKLV